MSRWPDARTRISLLILCAPALSLWELPLGAQALPASPQAAEPQVSTELEDMPDIGLDWPDLTAPEQAAGDGAGDAAPAVTATLAPGQESSEENAPRVGTGGITPPALEPDGARVRNAEALAAIDPGAELPYAVALTGADAVIDQTFEERFDLLSELRKGEKKKANLGQINRRGRADLDLVDQLMHTRGYYDARVTFRMILDRPQPPLVGARLQVVPGNRYMLSKVDLNGLSASNAREQALRDLFRIAPGEPADTDLILGAVTRLRTGLAEGGYPFATVSEPELRVDHDDRNAQLVVDVSTGGYRNFGRIILQGDPPFDAEHIADFARFKPGEPFNQADVTDLNSAIIATGLAGSLSITPKEGATDDTVDLIIAMSKAPPRTVAGLLGYGTGEGARAEVSWQHRNFFPPEGAVTLRTVVGTNEQSASAIFRRNNFHKRDRALNLEVTAANLNQNAYEARTFGVAASLERQTNLIFQKKWTWSLGTELRISDERRLYGTDPVPRRLLYVIGAVPVSLGYDGSDDLLNPSEGFRLSGRVSPELSLQGNVFGYVRLQMDGSAYMPMNDRLVLAGRVRLGTIVGAGRDRIAPTRRFYAGGGGSVRGYGYQAIGPRDINNDPLGGRSLTELAVEARFRFGSENQFGIVPFLDAGTISTDPLPSATDLRVGAGIGVRYYSNFGPIRIDVGTPINRQPGDSRIGVYVSLGQAF